MPPSNEQRPEDRLSARRLRAEVWLTRVGVLVTLPAFAGFGVEFLRVAATHRDPSELAQAAVFLFVVSFLVYGGLGVPDLPARLAAKETRLSARRG
jgi:hypothetical protein